MINGFKKWITYNPDNISVVDMLPEITILLLSVFVMWFLLLWMYTTKVTLHNVFRAIIYTPYSVFVMMWGLYCSCMNASFLVLMFPIYPILIIYIVKKGFRYIRKSKEGRMY